MADPARRYAGEIQSVDDLAVYGWIYDRQHPVRSPFLTLFERGVPVAVARPTIYRPDLQTALPDARRSVGFAIRRRNRRDQFCVAAPDATLLELNPNSEDLAWLLDGNIGDLPAPIIFLHIQNSMGTSIRNALAEGLSPLDVLFIYPEGLGVPMEEFFGIPALALARTRLIFGHTLFGIHEHLPLQGRYRTVLRCPVERLISNVIRISPAGSSFEEALAFFVRSDLAEFDNYQTRVLSGSDIPVGGVTVEHVGLAVSHADTSFDKIGFADDLASVRATLSEFIDPVQLDDDHASNYDRSAALHAFTQGPARDRLRVAVTADVYLYCTVCSRRGHAIRNAGLYATLGLI